MTPGGRSLFDKLLLKLPVFGKLFRMVAVSRFAKTLATMLAAGSASAAELGVPSDTFGKLDHVFFIIMENQTNTDILGNRYAPYINAYAKIANQATNYFAVGHPSAPNYLEITGGSNFDVTNDYWPNWLKSGCIDHAPGSHDDCANVVCGALLLANAKRPLQIHPSVLARSRYPAALQPYLNYGPTAPPDTVTGPDGSPDQYALAEHGRLFGWRHAAADPQRFGRRHR